MLFLAQHLVALLATAGVINAEKNGQHALLADRGPLGSSSLVPVARSCKGYAFPHVVCLQRFGAVLPGNFSRPVISTLANTDTYPSTQDPADPSFASVGNASFLVFNEDRAEELLGASPSVEFMFQLAQASHEGPVYVPETDELLFSRLSPLYLPQLVVDLKKDPPTLSERLADPPIYAGSGARYRKGLVYYSAIGGNANLGGRNYVPGLYALNVSSWKSHALLNNYFGYFFNGADDLDIDSHGQIWFSDNYYGRPTHTNTRAPQINAATWRFDTASGAAVMVDSSLVEPNGVQLSPDGATLYVTDTGAGEAVISPALAAVPPIRYNATGPRTVFAFDIDREGEGGPRLVDKRAVHLAMDYAPDGIKVTREGYIVTAEGHGLTVTDQAGVPLVRVQTNFTVINMAWTGPQSADLWAVGVGAAARVRFGLAGPLPEV